MKFNNTVVILLFFLSGQLLAQQYNRSYDESYYGGAIPTYSEEEIKQRVHQMNLCIPPKYTSAVRSYVKTYTVTKRPKSEHILGQAAVFFPIYEKYLAQQGMPQDLKYLSVLESALNPQATSRSNAAGLWQFMEATGKEYGLAVNRTVDERRDPHKSTQAALTYLKKLYNRYGDWALAIAAYNGGPGRVNRAIKRGRSKNFWRIQKYLPKETQNYVPAFFGAAYLLHYYQQHNLNPSFPDLDIQINDHTKVFNTFTFKQISQITGIPEHKIEQLNPSYKKQYIPASYNGNYLILPKRVMGSFKQYLQSPDSSPNYPTVVQVSNGNNDFFRTSYKVKPGENIYQIASIFGCEVYHIQAWNKLNAAFVQPGQELILYQPIFSSGVPSPIQTVSTSTTISRPIAKPAPPITLKKYNVNPVPSLGIAKINDTDQELEERSLETLTKERYIYHVMQRGESLTDIAMKRNVSVNELIKVNLFSRKNKPKPGQRIKIKRK